MRRYEPGSVIGGYTVDAYLGCGSSAEVYRAHDDRPADDPTRHPVVALKVLRTGPSSPGRVRERFSHEFEIASLLHHPNIVEMYARGELGADRPDTSDEHRTTLWIAMEYIDGVAASTFIAPAPAEPDVAVVLAIGEQIAAALDYAHRTEVLHRDVKPANIIVARPPDAGVRAVLTDFGIARLLDDSRPLARNGRVQGSIAYAAPELLTAQQLSPATDQYALAASMFELFTGWPPFPRATAFAITNAHLHDPVPTLTRTRPWLPSSLNSVFAKALAKNPADRYPTCSEFTEIVGRTLRDVPVPAPAVPRFGWWRRVIR